MSESLSWLLDPFDITSFLKHYANREHLHVARDLPDYYARLLNISDLDAFLQSERLPAAFVDVVKTGTRYRDDEWSCVKTALGRSDRVAIPERLFDLYSNGATLILNNTDRMLPAVNTFCRILASDLGFPTQANIYLTPPGAAGFGKHTDDHDVLVLQIAGSKKWRLDLQAEPLEIDLRCGDLLFLPRGLGHSAEAHESDSIHLALGLRPTYAFQLIEELALVAGAYSGLQQPLPPLFAGDGPRHEFGATFLRELQTLILSTTPLDLIERRVHRFVDNQARGWPGRLSDLCRLREMTQQTIVRRRLGILVEVAHEGKFLSVGFAGKRVLVPGFLDGALAKIMGADEFAVGEIDGFIGPEGKIRLAAEFVRAGLLQIVTD